VPHAFDVLLLRRLPLRLRLQVILPFDVPHAFDVLFPRRPRVFEIPLPPFDVPPSFGVPLPSRHIVDVPLEVAVLLRLPSGVDVQFYFAPSPQPVPQRPDIAAGPDDSPECRGCLVEAPGRLVKLFRSDMVSRLTECRLLPTTAVQG
jgi:hypothetical protein